MVRQQRCTRSVWRLAVTAIDAFAEYDAIRDPSGSGECYFEGSFDNLQTGKHATLGSHAPIQASVPYDQSASGYLPSDTYKLVVLPFTDCDWRVTILPASAAGPGIGIVSAGVYLMVSGKLTETTVVPMGETAYFIVSYSVEGKLPATLTGKVTIKESSGPPQTAPLKGETGVYKAYLSAVFSTKTHDVPGPATATFTLTAGKLQVTSLVHFTLGSGLGTPSG